MSSELPKGWASAPLATIAEINPRHPKGLDDSMPISFARMAVLSESKPEFESLEERTLGEVRKGFTHFAEGDVLFAKITPCMENGKGAVATGLRNGIGCGTTELHVIRPLAGIDPRYVYRFLAQPLIRRAAKENFTGTAGQARVPTSFIEELAVPLAPLAEQRRIVAKLETLLGKVDASQQWLAKIPVLLKRFRQSVLAAACSGRLTADWRGERDIDDEWPVEPLSELFEMRNGKSLIATKRQGGDVPVYGGNGHMGTHNKANANGSVIVIGRVGAQCGNVHYVSGKVWVTDNAISLQGKRELVPAFYAFFLRSLNLNQLSAGTGQPYVSQEILGPIETPVVSFPEQQEIVRRVEGLFALADQLELRLAKARGQVDKLTPSLLARAFAGKLVPQSPTDEPAEKLLGRIHEQSESKSRRDVRK